jgi:hypothetical protein
MRHKERPGRVGARHRPEQSTNDGDVTPSNNEKLAVELVTAATARGAWPAPEELGRKVDDELDADRVFFRRWPERWHRIRRVFPNERELVEAQARFHGSSSLLHDPETHAIFVAVKKVYAHARVRSFFIAPRDIETDLTEREARDIFDSAASPQVRQIVADIKAMGP